MWSVWDFICASSTITDILVVIHDSTEARTNGALELLKVAAATSVFQSDRE
jgi:hypothetical protein